MPVGYELFAGNKADVTTVKEIVTTMEQRHGKADRVWVMDRGMVSAANIEFLKEGGRRQGFSILADQWLFPGITKNTKARRSRRGRGKGSILWEILSTALHNNGCNMGRARLPPSRSFANGPARRA